MKEILIIRLSAMGDILLTTPVLARLKNLFPEARITFLVKEKFAEFIHAAPHADNTILWKEGEGVWEIRRKIMADFPRFDLILDLQSNFKSRSLALVLSAKQKRRYRKPYINRLLLVYFKKNRYREKKKISERYLDALSGITDEPLTERVSLRREKLPRGVQKFTSKKTVLIAPGARWFTKRWPEEYFVSLASRLLEKNPVCRVVWLGGKDEASLFSFLSEHPYLRRHAKRMLFQAGLLTTGQMATLADSVGVTITNDSGLMHLLSSSDTPMVSLFLSTVEEFGFFPLSPHAQVLAARNIECRPCSHTGLPACPKKHFRCARELTADQVYAAVIPYLA